jgi:hypothetical protein
MEEIYEEQLDIMLDKLLIEQGIHPARVRHCLHGEERQLAKDLVKEVIKLTNKL